MRTQSSHQNILPMVSMSDVTNCLEGIQKWDLSLRRYIRENKDQGFHKLCHWIHQCPSSSFSPPKGMVQFSPSSDPRNDNAVILLKMKMRKKAQSGEAGKGVALNDETCKEHQTQETSFFSLHRTHCLRLEALRQTL